MCSVIRDPGAMIIVVVAPACKVTYVNLLSLVSPGIALFPFNDREYCSSDTFQLGLPAYLLLAKAQAAVSQSTYIIKSVAGTAI